MVISGRLSDLAHYSRVSGSDGKHSVRTARTDIGKEAPLCWRGSQEGWREFWEESKERPDVMRRECKLSALME